METLLQHVASGMYVSCRLARLGVLMLLKEAPLASERCDYTLAAQYPCNKVTINNARIAPCNILIR